MERNAQIHSDIVRMYMLQSADICKQGAPQDYRLKSKAANSFYDAQKTYNSIKAKGRISTFMIE